MKPAEGQFFRSGVRILTVPRATEGRGRAVGAGWFGDVRRDTGPPAPVPLLISSDALDPSCSARRTLLSSHGRRDIVDGSSRPRRPNPYR